MLMHVPDAERAFTEMVRVIRRGGRLSVFDFDWETQIVDSPYTETTRLITRSFCDNFKNGWIGRRLPRLFKQHGMTDISIVPQTIIITYPFLELLLGGHLTRAQQSGVVSSADAERWWTNLREAPRSWNLLLCLHCAHCRRHEELRSALLRWGLQDSEAAAQPFINPSP